MKEYYGIRIVDMDEKYEPEEYQNETIIDDMKIAITQVYKSNNAILLIDEFNNHKVLDIESKEFITDLFQFQSIVFQNGMMPAFTMSFTMFNGKPHFSNNTTGLTYWENGKINKFPIEVDNVEYLVNSTKSSDLLHFVNEARVANVYTNTGVLDYLALPDNPFPMFQRPSTQQYVEFTDDEGYQYFPYFHFFYRVKFEAESSEQRLIIKDVSVKDQRLDFDQSELTLPYDSNNIAIKVTLNNFKAPKFNSYQYRLNDGEWIDEGRNNNIILSSLAIGETKVAMRGITVGENWSDDVVVMINILPPWYQTNLAYGIYVILLLAFIIAIYRIYKNRAIQERLQNELLEAAQTQAQLLPHSIPELKEFDLYGKMIPATEVGGDYYDFLHISNSLFGIVVGDATGHGMSSGLVVSMTKMAIKPQTQVDPAAAIVLSNVNVQLSEVLHDAGMALCYALFDMEKKTMEISIGAVPYPYYYNAEEDTLSLIKVRGLPLGKMAKAKYRSETIHYKSGDMFFFITDGIPEAANRKDEIYGYKRTETLIKGLVKTSAAEATESMMNEAINWQKNTVQLDDMTVVVVKVK